MNFVIRLPILTNWKDDSYDLILVIVDWLTKIIYYELVKIIIDNLNLAKVILDMIIQYHTLSNLIVSNKSSVSF